MVLLQTTIYSGNVVYVAQNSSQTVKFSNAASKYVIYWLCYESSPQIKEITMDYDELVSDIVKQVHVRYEDYVDY